MTKIFSADLPIEKFFNLTRRLRKLNDSGDSFCQRLNIYVAAVLFISSFLSYGLDVFLAKDNEGVSVFCYCPAEFSKSRVHYTNYACFVQGFYSVAFDESLQSQPSFDSRDENEDDEKFLKYYPWVTYILILQAVLFCIPRFLWRLGANREGFHHNCCLDIMDTYVFGKKDDETEPKMKEEVIKNIENYFIRLIDLRNSDMCFPEIVFPFLTGYRYTIWLVITDVFMVVNSISQFYLVEFLLGIDFIKFGSDYFSNMPDLMWEDHRRFPRSAFCDLNIRQQANQQVYTIQCALPSNMINEKLFLLIWVTLFCVSILNIFSFFYHVITLQRISFKTIEKINSYQLSKYFNTEKLRSNLIVRSFVYEYLKLDVLLYLWQLNRKPVVDDVIYRLWDRYSRKQSEDEEQEGIESNLTERH